MEIVSSQNEYCEPDQTELVTIEAEQLGPRALANLCDNYRVSKVEKGHIVREPRQDGVLRYPPVQVQLERDPRGIKAYIEMPPTDLSFWQGSLNT